MERMQRSITARFAALVGDKVSGLMAHAPEKAFETSPHGGRSGLATEDG